jgi:hypothetical protein
VRSLRERYLAAAGGSRLLAAVMLARGLMQGDPEKFKAGYTKENALLAAYEMFDINDDAHRRTVAVLLGVAE